MNEDTFLPHELTPDEEIRLYLCHPSDRKTIAELHHIKNRVLSEYYGGVNDLSFSVPYYISDETGKRIKNPLFDQVQSGYLVRFEQGNKTQYYVIYEPNKVTDEDNKRAREIVCRLDHYEWSDKIVRGFTGTKRLYDPVGSDGVLNETLLTKTDYSVAYVDSSLMDKYRTFDVSEQDLLSFVYEAIETYGSYIPIIDTVNKTISIYLDENIAFDEGLEITYGKYLKSLSEQEKYEDIKTRLYVYGRDNLSINSINPAGTDYIESFDYFLDGYKEDEHGNVIGHSKYMSDSLCKAINDYNKLLEQKQGEFESLLSSVEASQNQLTQRRNELFNLENELIQIEDSIDAHIADGENLDHLNQQRDAKEIEINNK